MPGLPDAMSGNGSTTTNDMPAGAMSSDAGAMAEAGGMTASGEMPAGQMDESSGPNGLLGNAGAAATVMQLEGQWHMSFWVTPKS